MQRDAEQSRGAWGNRIGFVLAAAGSAVGLGNIWKFPYITGENGGGLFVLIYLVCIALVGIPIMAAEIMIGRAARKQPVVAFEVLQGRRTSWSMLGWMGVICGFIILSYYIVVAGWAMDYSLKSVVGYTDPIHAQAEKEATAYSASTSIDEMRSMLAGNRAEKRAKARVTDIHLEAPGSVWAGYERFELALAEAGDVEASRRALLTDPVLAAQVKTARELEKRIEKVKAEALREAEKHYRSLSEAEVRAEAKNVKRRGIIFDKVDKAFGSVATDGWTCTFWAALFMLLVIIIVAGGISSGIERWCRTLMPTLVVLMLLMVVYGAFQPGFGEAISFVFKPDPSRLKPSGVLEALGHAFFTLSLGMGAMITYGSYQARKENLAIQSGLIAGLDTFIALLACMMIFPIIFSYGQEPNAGPGLVFKSMPLAFAEIGRGGMMLAILFFGLLVVAALTSAISLLEVVASYFIDKKGWSRARAAWIMGGVIFLFGVPSAFSFDPDFAMASWEPTFGKTFFDTMDYLASNWLLPLGGLLVSIYAGWFMPRRLIEAEVVGLAPALVKTWLVLLRIVAPVLVILVLLQKVGILDANELFYRIFG